MTRSTLERPGPPDDPETQTATTSLQEADALLTADRDEVKYRIAPSQVQALATALARQLPHHRYTGQGANSLPRPRHFVTTVYFDTASRHQYRASRADADHNLKMRAKEYYDLHPSLAELATDARQIVRYKPVLWLELKFKEGNRSGKRRIGIPKRQVPDFFRAGVVTPEMIELQRSCYGAESEAVLSEIAAYCRRYDEPMQADCLVNYRRLPWQDARGQPARHAGRGDGAVRAPRRPVGAQIRAGAREPGPTGAEGGSRDPGAEVPGRATRLAAGAAGVGGRRARAVQQVRDGLGGDSTAAAAALTATQSFCQALKSLSRMCVFCRPAEPRER